MNKLLCSSLSLLSILGLLFPNHVIASVEHHPKIPQFAFAAMELNAVLIESARDDLTVTLTIETDQASSEAFQNRSSGPNQITL